jgi:hypothetical protein
MPLRRARFRRKGAKKRTFRNTQESGGGGYRPTVTLKALNNFVAYFLFKMEGLDAVKQLLEPGDFKTKIDIKDANLCSFRY